MNETDELERRFSRTALVSLHALTELAIKKGLFTRNEFRESCRWFSDAFNRMDTMVGQPENQDWRAPSAELHALYNEIEKRLFGG
jgi:hypothetical protein